MAGLLRALHGLGDELIGGQGVGALGADEEAVDADERLGRLVAGGRQLVNGGCLPERERIRLHENFPPRLLQLADDRLGAAALG